MPGEALREKLRSLPAKPGVYQMLSGSGEVLYIGKAVNLRSRVRSYFQSGIGKNPRLRAMTAKVADVEIIVTDSEVEALILETTLIKERKPRYNVDLKDDKSYPYIVITNEPYPRVFPTRRIIRDGSKYFGPYTDVRNMHSSLKMVRDMYRVRSCNFFIDDEAIRKKKFRLCLDYHIRKCDGPCEGLIDAAAYRDMIREVELILRGRTSALAAALRERMDAASAAMRYEEAAELRDRIAGLDVYNQRQKIVDLDLVDRDLVALAVKDNDGCAVVLKVREGKITGKQHFYLSSLRGQEEPAVLEHFLGTYYLETDDLPAEIHLPAGFGNRHIVEEWLSRKKGNAVRVVAPKAGKKALLMKMCRKNAELFLGMLLIQREKRRSISAPAVELLGRDLGMERAPRRIECFDVSHTQGSDTVGSMVVFVNGRPRKSEYRKFNVASLERPDDFAAMREIVGRRYERLIAEGAELPDLIVIDGGKGQLSSAMDALSRLRMPEVAEERGKKLRVIGLAKRLEEIHRTDTPEPQSIPKSSPGLKLLQRIRNEAHRFAVAYHRTRRAGRTLQTELDLIEGVGKKRATRLLEAFGSVQGVRFATPEQIAEVVGEAAAEKIRRHFRGEGENHETAG
ncbi:MAG TPA: excinuclease ABC subunit UvrC [Bacteroidota bacterium]|nr:excinuclease ABC subunit UvrC [Bacteroidota bacterium]